MVTVIVFTTIGLVYGIRWRSQTTERQCASVIKPLILISSVLLGCTAGYMLAVLMASRFATHLVPIEQINLVSLRNSDAISGSFFLGTGTVDNHEYYFYFKQVGSGFVLEKLDAENGVTIYEGDHRGGKLVISKMAFVSPRAHYWAFLDDEQPRYAFYVPKGSFQRNFSLN